jgi:cell division protein ZapA (FtsZ GTPase activity inhibitor)
MSGQGYEELKILNRKLDELLMKYNNLRTECSDLKSGNEALKYQLQERDAGIKELEIKYERIKLSGALLGEGESASEAKKKINELVREIDRCVALLNKLSIRVNVADRYYPLKVERENEEKIRKAARMINEKVLQYKQRYTDKDVQDFLAMAALQYVIKLTEEEEKLENDYLPDAIKELIQKIDSVLEIKE